MDRPRNINLSDVSLGKYIQKKGRSRSRSRTRSKPRSGNLKTVGGLKLIYTSHPIILASGKEVHGRWVPAIDPNGKYGGPFSDYMNLLRNPEYIADMESRDGAHRAALGAPSRSGMTLVARRPRRQPKKTRKQRPRPRGRTRKH
jgi:hypothetical protein